MSIYLGTAKKNIPFTRAYLGNNLIFGTSESRYVDTDFTVRPHPTAWEEVVAGTNYKATNDWGEWTISASSAVNTHPASHAFDGSEAYTCWQSEDLAEGEYAWLEISCPTGITIKPSWIDLRYSYVGDGSYFQGYNTATGGWENLRSISATADTSISMPSFPDVFYSKFRFYFSRYSSDFPAPSSIELVIKRGTIRQEGSSYEQLINYTMLYDHGDECTDVTGRWTSGERYYHFTGGTGVFILNDTYVRYGETGTSYGSKYAGIKSKINFGGYNTAFYKGRIFNNKTNYNKGATLGIITSVDYTPGDTLYQSTGWQTMIETFILDTNDDNSTGIDISMILNISEFLGEGYFFLQCNSGAMSNDYMYADCYACAIAQDDHWQTLCAKAGLTANTYANETALCADESAITAILSNASAVEFMIKQCTGSFMMAFISSSTALTVLNNSSYKSIIYANEHWAKFLNMVA